MAILSIPIPNANPEYTFESMLEASKTFGSTIPHPIISSHPVPLHILHPLPPHKLHEISISADGSVIGGEATDGAAGNDSRAFRWTEAAGI